MQALILAGGEGTRLRPLTYTVPKPVLPLAGRPHIAYVIDWLVSHGVDDVIVSCGHLAERVRRALEQREPGVTIRYAEEPDARGTAGAIRFAEEMLAERFLVLNGDILCDLDLTAQIEQHERTGARGTLALYPVADPSGYGLIHRRDDGEITEFLEKPEPHEIDTDEINAGAYLLERSVLEQIPPDRAVSIEREVFPHLVGHGLYGIRLEGYWIDIGTPDKYLQAHRDIMDGRFVAAPFASGTGGACVSPDARIENGAIIEGPCFIDRGVVIKKGATIKRYSVIGHDCHIDEDASIDGAILWPNTWVDREARLGPVIAGRHAHFGRNVQIDGGVFGDKSVITDFSQSVRG